MAKNLQIKIKNYFQKKMSFMSLRICPFNFSKAFEHLNWKTLLSAKVSLKMTFEWYKKFYDKKSNNEILKFTFNQIKDYLKKLK